MKKEKKTRHSLSIPGVSLLILIFLSLTLVTFALLSLTEAKADARLSDKTLARTSAYYQTCSKANQLLAYIDQLLLDCYHKSGSALYEDSLASILTDQEDFFYDPAGHTITFSLPLSEDQILSAVLLLQDPSPSAPLYEIEAWQIITVTDWVPSESEKYYIQTETTQTS